MNDDKPPEGGWIRFGDGPYLTDSVPYEGWDPDRMRYGPPDPPSTAKGDPNAPSTIFIMLDDQVAIYEDLAKRDWGRDPDEPEPKRVWRGSDQQGAAVLDEFESPDRDEVIAWARRRPAVKTIYVYSEEDQDIHPLD